MPAVQSSPRSPDRRIVRARAGVAALFLTNGAVFFNVVPRYPQIKADLGLSNAALGTALALYPVGALVSGLFAGAVIRRFSSARAASFGVVLSTAATLLIPIASNVAALGLALFVVGALDSVIDVGQNAHGLRVQRRYGRSILNSLHGVWSMGAVLGGLMGSAAVALDLSLAVHLTISAVIFSAVALTAYRYLLPGPDDGDPARIPADGPLESVGVDHPPAGPPARRRFAGPALRMLAALGLLAACGALIEDAGASWGALYLSDLHAGPATAGLAVVAFQAAMTIGRLTGDRAVDRFGQRTVARAGAAVTAAGLGAALALPSVGSALAGFALAGLGFATLVPAAMHTADELPGLAPGTGLTVVSWLLRGGFLVSPPLVGYIADLTSLRVGLLTAVLAALVTVVLARVLVNRPSTAASHS